MTIKNKYSNRSKISEKKIRDIVRLFALDLGALQIAILLTVISKQFENELLIIVNNNPHFLVRLKLINVTSELVELQDNEAADHMEKLSFLASSNKTVVFTQKLFPIVRDVRSKQLYAAMLTSRQSSILMGGEGITALSMWGIKNIFAFTMDTMNLLPVHLLSMVSKASGHMQRPE
jgi:hypothetical protein